MKSSVSARKVKKGFFSFLINRLTITVILLLIQFFAIVFSLVKLQDYLAYAYPISLLIAICIVIWLVRKEDNPAYKIAWIILILLLPFLGGIFYLLWGNTPISRSRLPQIPSLQQFQLERHKQPATEALCMENPEFRRTCQYLYTVAEMPVWQNTSTQFYPLGEQMFEAMLIDLEKAEKFIFLEYFIIEPGIVWDSILEILIRKAQQGVDVRVMYDDAGCLATLPLRYNQTLTKMGIRTVKFNQFLPMLYTYLNYRDHRKMCIVDGNVAFTGGINLADEYINRKERFGHWKDTGIRLCGDGVMNLTALFLQLWDFSTKTKTQDFSNYLPTVSAETDGYVQAFADSPLDSFNVSETAFMSIINHAQKYVYITSPYLTLDNEMLTALCTAAQSGIDVRIVTPGIPDKSYVYAVTRSYYAQLIRAGVRIYEYTPGFLHAKMIVSDDEIAIVGTINMDFRSFYLHFECGSVFYHSSIIKDVKADILDTIDKSRPIDQQWISSQPWIKSIFASVLRLFAPLL